MKNFMKEEFCLKNNIAKMLYNNYARELPIVDYHCHLSAKEIYEDRKFDNITQLWLESDHYKWRLMRANGVDENYVTGNASDWEKFEKWAQTLEKAIGNPLYHWCHMELKTYFDYEGYLCADNAQRVWKYCNEKIKKERFSARKLIQNSNVEVICTTDAPADSLKWHRAIRKDADFNVRVLPTWRPEKAMSVNRSDYVEYLQELAEISRTDINSYESLIQALHERMDFFEANGCTISDHSLEYVMYEPAAKSEIEKLFAKRLSNNLLTDEEVKIFETAFMADMAAEYQKRNWAMQLHYGVLRNVNSSIFQNCGSDAGVDCINNYASAKQFSEFFNHLNEKNQLPKTIVYSLNPNDNAMIETVAGCFQDASCIGKIQHGSAWWFNDNKKGIEEHLKSIAGLGLFGNFIGMLTDSRSFLSYVRHDYFRRILCNVIGEWVEDGEFPNDMFLLKRIIEDVCYYNANTYFWGSR